MKREINMVPRLRFPEFKDKDRWIKVKLSDLGNLINGLTYSPDDVRDEGLLVLRSSNIQDGIIDLKDSVFVREDIKGANLTQPNDILICIRNGSKNLIGKNALISYIHKLTTHGAFMTVFRTKYPQFVFQLFQTSHYEKQVQADLGATINSINGKNFIKYEFPIPSPQEQQKIASCLSSLDNLITAHKEKLEAIKDHKKGLIQNLFPKEGEKVPKYRFPEFRNDGEWLMSKIGKLTSVYTGGTPSTSEQKYWNGEIPWMSSGELNFKKVYQVEKKISQLGLTESSTKLIPKYSVLIGLAGQGKTRGTAAINYIELCINQSIAAILPNSKKFNSDFLYFKIDSMYKQLRELSTGQGGRGGLNLSIIRDIEISVPSLSEQQKIASCLSEVDNLIHAQATKIEELQNHKKGLMQGLFPQLEN